MQLVNQRIKKLMTNKKMEYVVDQTAYNNPKGTKFNALSKARADVTTILTNKGGKPFNIYVRKYAIPKLSGVIVVFYYIKLYLMLKKGDVLYVQYPIKLNFIPYFCKLLRRLKKKNIDIIFIIHDLDYLRIKDRIPYKNVILSPLYIADKLIVHTPAMKKHLVEEGIDNDIRVLHIFDYLTSDSFVDDIDNNRNEIIFAGNLIKSNFLKALNNLTFNHLSINLYGIEPDYIFNNHMKYCGCFNPEQTSSIKGRWGLVWDGDSIRTCEGLMGQYLRYNASHKISLYIAAGIPVIIWKESGVANWILENKLGIAIESLDTLESSIASIGDCEYADIKKNVRRMSLLVRKGQMLLQALQ